jgi:hypothetical protein
MDPKDEKAWRVQLEQSTLENVKLKLARSNLDLDSPVRGFKDPRFVIPRGFVEDWVAEEENKAAKERRSTMVWAIVAGVTGILALVATVVGIVIQLAH